MAINPMVAARAMLVGGVAAFAKVGAAVKAAGGVKIGAGAAAAAVTAAATTAVSGSKQEKPEDSKPPSK